MIIADIGINHLGINVTNINDEYYLFYPIHIFSAKKSNFSIVVFLITRIHFFYKA